MKNIVFLFVVLFIFVSNAFATELKGTPDELRKFLHPEAHVVSLSSEVERRVYADQAIVSIIVKTEGRTLAKAMQANAKLRASLKASLMDASVNAEDIQNSKFSSSPQFGWFGDEPTSFEVVNRVAVKIDSEAVLQALAGITDQHKEMSIAETEFKHSTKDNVYREMKKEAMTKILESKAYYESSLQVSLKTRAFYDSGVNIGTTNGELALGRMISHDSSAKRSMLSSSYDPSPFDSESQSFEEILYKISVRVDFEITGSTK